MCKAWQLIFSCFSLCALVKRCFEWQLAENIVYCDYLEHLFLHILICENPAVEKNVFEAVGIGGVVNFLVPELNDVFSGWKTNQTWRETCHNAIKDDKEVYMALLRSVYKELHADHETGAADNK